ncbi:MAG: MFS transporter, partial [Pseudomonadota bacterium]
MGAPRALLAIYSVFFIEGFVLGNWIPRIPAVKELFGLSATQLGFCLFALAFGTLIAFLFGGSRIKVWGLKASCRYALVVWCLGIGLVPWMPNLSVLIGWLVLAGIAIGLCEIAMNTAADLYERDTKTRVMSKSHGFWSLGSLGGAVVGAGFASAEITVATHFAVVLGLCVLVSLITTGPMAEGRSTKVEQHTFKLPNRGMVALCLMPVGIMLIEGAFIDWSALFVQDVLAGSAVAIGAIYAAFSTVMAVTRLSGDWLLDRYGALRVAQVSAVSAVIGIAIFASAPNVGIAFLGALFSGLGVAIFYPLTMSAAAKRPGDAADNVAAMSLFAFTSFMLGPPLLGAVADWAGLR